MQTSTNLLLIVLLAAATVAKAAPAVISASCRAAIDAEVNAWHFPTVSEEVAAWARQEHFNPVVAAGDFDGNGEADEAVLVETAGGVKIAVCLSTRHRSTLKLIERPYCSDYVAVSPAHSEHYNYDTDVIEKIRHDGISVGCFEKAGATYVYEHAAFRRIVDSD